VTAPRVTARLKLIALIRELPEDADITLGVHFLSREDFDRLPGTDERQLGTSRCWTKDFASDGVSVDLFTNERPATVIGFPPRPGELRLVGGQEGGAE
jgi:hypothetical protein